MNKTEFLQRLEAELLEIPAEERAGALQYYTEYLEDAGPDGEDRILEQLGCPEEIAADIKKASGWVPPKAEEQPQAPTAENAEAEQEPAAYAPELTLEPEPFRYWEAASPPPAAEQPASAQPLHSNAPNYGGGNQGTAGPRKPDTVKIILIVLLCFFCWPVALGILMVLVTLACIPFILALAFGITSIVCLVSPFTLGGVGAAGAIFSAGVGLFLLGLTLLCGFLGSMVFSKLIPAFFRGIRNIFSSSGRKRA